MKKKIFLLFLIILFIIPFGVKADVKKNHWDVCNDYYDYGDEECRYYKVEDILKENIPGYGEGTDYNNYSVVFENQISIPSTGLKMGPVDISKNWDNTVIAFVTDDNTLHIQFDGVLVLNAESTYLFYFHNSSLTNIDGLNYLDTSHVVSMDNMFYDVEATELDLSSFDTSNVENMDFMFGFCEKLKTIYVSDLWSMDKVEENDSMFIQTYNLIGGFGTRSIEYTSGYGTILNEYAVIDSKTTKGFLSYKYDFDTDYYTYGKYIYVDGEFDLDNINISDNVSKSKVGNYVYISKGNTVLKELEIKNISDLSNLKNEELYLFAEGYLHSVDLEWDESEYAEKYEIYRSTDEINYEKIDTVDYYKYYDENVKSGITYYYRIKAVNKNYSVWSYVAEVVVVPDTPELYIKTTTLNSVTLAWEYDMYDDETADGYEIYQCSDSEDEDTCKLIKTVLDSKTRSYKVTGLKTGKTYYYRIKSFVVRKGERCYGYLSSDVTATTKVGKPILSIKSTSTTSIKLSWTKSEEATGYQIYEYVSGKWKKIKTTTGTSYTIEKLKFRSKHNYRIRALKEAKAKTYYSDYDVIAIIVGLTTPKLTIESTSPTSIKASWNEVPKADTYMYELYDKDADWNYHYYGGSDNFFVDGVTKETFVTFDNLRFGSEYQLTVTPLDSKYDDDVDDYRDFQALVTSKFKMSPVKPTVTIKQNSITSIKLSWTASERADSYQVYRSTKEKEGYKLIKETTDLEYLDTNVKYGTKYYYKVRTKTTLEDKTVYSAYSAIVNKTTKIGKPTITVSSKSYNSNKITITQVKDATGYEIYRSTSKNGTYKKIKTTSSLEYTDSKLSFNKTYYYKVRSYVTINKVKKFGSYSDKKSIKTKLNKPTISLDLGESKLTININKVSGATGYEVYRSYDGSNWTKYKTVKDLSKPVTDKTTSKAAFYKVRAYRTVSGKNIYGSYSSIQQTANYRVKVEMVEDFDPARYLKVYDITGETLVNDVKALYAGDYLIDDTDPFTIDMSSIEDLPSVLIVEFNDGTKVPAILVK